MCRFAGWGQYPATSHNDWYHACHGAPIAVTLRAMVALHGSSRRRTLGPGAYYSKP